jgi:integrase
VRTADNREVRRSNRRGPITFLQKDESRKIDSGINTKDFEKYLRLQKSLSESRVKSHIGNLNIYFKSNLELDDFMMKVKNERAVSTYRDYLKQPEIIQDYKFPNKPFKPKILPTKGELNIFYNALGDKHEVLFLMLASSGLRVSELLNTDIDKNKRMLISTVIPRSSAAVGCAVVTFDFFKGKIYSHI